MALLLLTLPANKGGRTLINGVDAVLVEADDAAAAKEFAAALFAGDSAWSDASSLTVAAQSADLEGWTYRLRVAGGAAQTVPVDVSAVGAESDVFDDVGAALATALNATPDIANAAYAAMTNTLTVAGAGDGIGDATVSLEVFAPGAAMPLASFVGTVVDQGDAGDALSVVLEEPTAVPVLLRALRSQ